MGSDPTIRASSPSTLRHRRRPHDDLDLSPSHVTLPIHHSRSSSAGLLDLSSDSYMTTEGDFFLFPPQTDSNNPSDDDVSTISMTSSQLTSPQIVVSPPPRSPNTRRKRDQSPVPHMGGEALLYGLHPGGERAFA